MYRMNNPPSAAPMSRRELKVAGSLSWGASKPNEGSTGLRYALWDRRTTTWAIRRGGRVLRLTLSLAP